MKSGTSILKRAYDAFALFAVLNLLALVAVAAYVVGSGIIGGQKMQRIVDVLRGEATPEEQPPVEAVTRESAAVETGQPAQPSDPGAAHTNLEVVRREAARIEAELAQRLAQVNNILIRVTAEREAFQRERQHAAAQQTEVEERRDAAGFERQVEIYEALSPKVAAEHILSMPSADDAARLLMEMDSRKAKKIVEAAKGPQEMERMREIVQRLREVAPQKSNEING